LFGSGFEGRFASHVLEKILQYDVLPLLSKFQGS